MKLFNDKVVDKLYFIKLILLCKRPSKWWKGKEKTIASERIFPNHICNKILLYKTYSELSKFNEKIQFKMGKGMNRSFIEENTKRANKHMKDVQCH